MVDTYIDCVIPYPDPKVAATFIIGCPVKYATKTGYNITDKCILNHVYPHIASLLPRQILLVLGCALLWAIYDEEASQQIEDWIKNRAKSAFNITDGCNPIAMILLFVSGNDGNLASNEIDTDKERGTTNNQTNNMNELTFIMSQMRELRRQNDKLKTDLPAFKVAPSSLLQHMNTSQHKTFVAPAVGRITQTDESVQANESDGNIQKIPLIKCPRTLGVLWT